MPIKVGSVLSDDPVVVKATKAYRIIALGGKEFVDFRDLKHSVVRNLVYSKLSESVDSDILDDYSHRYPVTMLTENMHALMRVVEDIGRDVSDFVQKKPLLALIAYLKKHKGSMEALYHNRREKGLIDMCDVPHAFPLGSQVVYRSKDDGLIGGVVRKMDLQQSMFIGPYYRIQLQVVHAIKGSPEEGMYDARLSFAGIVPIESLPLRAITDEDKAALTERGKKYMRFYRPGSYASYTGNITQHSWWASRVFRADGRVVVDPVSFERTQSDLWQQCMGANAVQIRSRDTSAGLRQEIQIQEKDYWRCIPFLYGFSLTTKQWGRLELAGLSDVNWRHDAFEQLVLDAADKDLIYSLVKFHGTGFTDIIEGKGGGCIFLLHGKPGFGKTASAEAVAELLHKPLYSVSVGELGVDPKTLEDSLRNILDVATIWNAVILLDEADIFLEERDEHNIARNAMVGVFLRLLEYHNGVLFLTTNRVKNFDKAFYSRISVALHYKDEAGKAEKIWKNLLTAAGLDPQWSKPLAKHTINGRQIKNSIRMGQTLARAKNRDVELADIERAVASSCRFETDMADKASAATK